MLPPYCPNCGIPSRPVDNKWNKHECGRCGLYSYHGKPLASAETHKMRKIVRNKFEEVLTVEWCTFSYLADVLCIEFNVRHLKFGSMTYMEGAYLLHVLSSETLRSALRAPMEKEPEWYEVLGLEPNCGAVAIKLAYRKLAQSAHPDRPGGSTAAMQAINAAYTWAKRIGRVT